MLHRAFGLEQRRDIDLVGDPEQPREIDRGKDGLRVFALGDQHADRRVAVHMVQDLRHGEELPERRRVLDRERGEVRPQWLHPRKQGLHSLERSAAR